MRRARAPLRAAGPLLAFLALAAAPLFAADAPLENVLPVPECAGGWTLTSRPILYDRNTLFDRIDGEAELYFPYGFDALASAAYASPGNPRIGVDADVYRMGSLLDAFGIYASYRRKDATFVNVGAEGMISSTQLLFYQDRYFIRLQATGTTNMAQETFLSCAHALSRNLPRDLGPPREVEAFEDLPVVPKSERYFAHGLLGYDFFRRGLVADATRSGVSFRLFAVFEESPEAAARALDRYRTYLRASGKEPKEARSKGRTSLESADPLYGNVYVEQEARFLVGALRIGDDPEARRLVEQLRRNLGGGTGGAPAHN